MSMFRIKIRLIVINGFQPGIKYFASGKWFFVQIAGMHGNELLAALIKDFVSPFLKKNGFTKKNLNYYKVNGDMSYLVNFQKDANNSHHNTRFYINCGIHSTVIDDLLGNPHPKVLDGVTCFFYDRINDITGSAYPYHELKEGVDMEDITISVMSDLEKTMRFFNGITNADTLLDILSTTRGLVRYTEVLTIILKTGQLEKMKGYAKKIYDVKPQLEDRWPRFEKKINDMISEAGLDKKLDDFV